MSATFKATADELTSLSGFLTALTEATAQGDVTIYGSFTVMLPSEHTIDARWDVDTEAYVIDDMVGQ